MTLMISEPFTLGDYECFWFYIHSIISLSSSLVRTTIESSFKSSILVMEQVLQEVESLSTHKNIDRSVNNVEN